MVFARFNFLDRPSKGVTAMTTTTRMIEVTGFTRSIATFASQAANFVRQVIVARRNRKTIMSLGEWNDEMLHDIGVTRADLHSAIGTSLLDDPSERLGALADVRSRVRAARSII
jgi:uncharacterized protein YjiS (DUF1127 family)